MGCKSWKSKRTTFSCILEQFGREIVLNKPKTTNYHYGQDRMKFKAKMSHSLTFVKGRQIEAKFSIAGEKMPTVKEEPVKSLGRWYAGILSD